MERITKAKIHVDCRRCAFEDSECADDGWRHSILWLIDLEVLKGALGLCAPVFVRGDLDFAEGVCLCTCGLLYICVSICDQGIHCAECAALPTILDIWNS